MHHVKGRYFLALYNYVSGLPGERYKEVRQPKRKKSKEATNTSLIVLHSPKKRDSGGIHLTGRRAFASKKRPLAVTCEQGKNRCFDPNRSKQLSKENKCLQTLLLTDQFFSLYTHEGKTLPEMPAYKCHHVHHAPVQSQKFCTLGFRQRECYGQPNHDGLPESLFMFTLDLKPP